MDDVTPFQAWFFAIRPKTLTAAFISVLVGSSLAFVQGPFDWTLAALMLISSFLIQIASNLVNDAADFQKGADSKERVGFPRATQMGWLTQQEVMRGAWLCFALAFVLALPLVFKGGAVVFVLLLLSIAAAYGYTAGPYPLAYHGLGELFVMLFFGYVCTGIAYYVQTGTFSAKPLLAGTQVGLLATALIAINNLRDIDGDRKVGKKTLAALYGKTFARLEITFCLMFPFLINYLWGSLGLPVAGFLPLSIAPMTFLILVGLWRNEPGPLFNGFFVLTALVHLVFGLLLTTGILLNLMN